MGTQAYGRSPKPIAALKSGAIAKALRLTPERVRDRIAGMEEAGLISGYGIVPNSRHLGVETSWYYYAFPDDDAVDRAMEKLEPVDGVAACCAFLGGLMCVGIYHRSPADLERKLRLLLALAGEGELRKFFDVEMPLVHRPLSRLDWLIVQALRPDAVQPPAEVARDLRVSAKTVKRRLDRMANEGSVFVVPWLDGSKAEGMFLFYLLVGTGEEAGPGTLNALRRAFDGSLVSVDLLAARELGTYSLLLAAKSMSDADALRRAARKVKGVSSSRPFLFRAASESDAWVDEAIAERVAVSRGRGVQFP